MDSSSDIFDEVLEGDIEQTIVPLKLVIGNDEYVDNADLDVDGMLAAMKAFDGPTSSSTPSIGEFAAAFRKAKNTICVTMTSALSATYETALQAKEMVLKEDPSRNIHVIDTRATAGKIVLVGEEAARLIREGLSFADIAAKLDQYNKSLKLIFSMERFDNLIKNGRMPKYQGKLVQMLKIRPIAFATDAGEIEVIDKPRGEVAMLRKMVERMQEFKNLDGLPVIISHCNALDAVTKLKAILEETTSVKSVRLLKTRGLCSYYTDEGGFIVGF
jgi:DegV family protein with EDD domain